MPVFSGRSFSGDTRQGQRSIITVVLGTTTMPIHQAVRLGRGAIIELDATEEDEVQDPRQQLSRWPRAPWWSSGNRIAVEVKQMLLQGADKR